MSGIVLTGIAACRRSSYCLGLLRVSYRPRCGLTVPLGAVQPRRRKHDGSRPVSGNSDEKKSKAPGSTSPVMPIHMGPGITQGGQKEEPGKGAGGAAPPNPPEVPTERRPEAPFENSPELPSARPSPAEVKPQNPTTITCILDKQGSDVHSPNQNLFQLGQLDVKSSNEDNNKSFDGEFQSNPAQPTVEFINDPKYNNDPVYVEFASDSQGTDTPKVPDSKGKSKGFIDATEDTSYATFFSNEPVTPEQLRIRAALQSLSEEEQKAKLKAKAKRKETASKDATKDAKKETNTQGYHGAKADSEPAPQSQSKVGAVPRASSTAPRGLPQSKLGPLQVAASGVSNPNSTLDQKPMESKHDRKVNERTAASNRNLFIKTTPATPTAREAGPQTPAQPGTSADNSERSSSENQASNFNPKSSSFDLPGEGKIAGPQGKTGHSNPSLKTTPSPSESPQPPKNRDLPPQSSKNTFRKFWRPNDSTKEGSDADQNVHKGDASGLPGDESAITSEAANWRLHETGAGGQERKPEPIAREILNLMKVSETSPKTAPHPVSGIGNQTTGDLSKKSKTIESKASDKDKETSEYFKDLYNQTRTEYHKQPAEDLVNSDYVQKWIEKFKVQLEGKQAMESDAVSVKKSKDSTRRTVPANPDSPYASINQETPDCSFKSQMALPIKIVCNNENTPTSTSNMKPISSSDLKSDKGSTMNVVGADMKPVEFILNPSSSQRQSTEEVVSLFSKTGGSSDHTWKMGSTKKEDIEPKTTQEIVAMFKDDTEGDQTKAQEGRVRELFEQLDKFDKGQDRWWTLDDLSKATKTSQAEVRAILAPGSTTISKKTSISPSELKSSKENDSGKQGKATGIATSESKSAKETSSKKDSSPKDSSKKDASQKDASKKDASEKNTPKASVEKDKGGKDHFSDLNNLNTKIRKPTLQDLMDEKIEEKEDSDEIAKLAHMDSKILDDEYGLGKDEKKKYMEEIAKLKDELEEKEDHKKKTNELNDKISSFMEAAEQRRRITKATQIAKYADSDKDYQPKSELTPGDLYDPIADEVSSSSHNPRETADAEDSPKEIKRREATEVKSEKADKDTILSMDEAKTKVDKDEVKTKVDEEIKKENILEKKKPEVDRGELALKLLDKETAKPPVDLIPPRPAEKSFIQILFDKILGGGKKAGDDPKRKMSTYVGRRRYSTTSSFIFPPTTPVVENQPVRKEEIPEPERKKQSPSHCSLQEPQIPQRSFYMFGKKDKKKKSKDLTEIQGGSPLCKDPKKTPRELLKEKSQSRDIKILGGSVPCAEKLASLEKDGQDDDCNTRNFSSGISQFARQIWFSIFSDATDRSPKAK
ncbi:hypothetical protein KR074_002082 [Drosophila pseudoananassae]|nr:hypothetical protein KR074_002082 [Drosophila pseudoananassae]